MAAAKRGDEPLCLAAGLWASSNLRVWESKGKCAVSSWSWIDMAERSCSFVRGMVKSWLSFFWEVKLPLCSFKEPRPLQIPKWPQGNILRCLPWFLFPLRNWPQSPCIYWWEAKKMRRQILVPAHPSPPLALENINHEHSKASKSRKRRA